MNRAFLPLPWTPPSGLRALWDQSTTSATGKREAPIAGHIANNVGNENLLYPHFIPLLFFHPAAMGEKHACAAKP